MRYHYEKPGLYVSLYGEIYLCDHPVYDCCTLFKMDSKGLAIIQQRFDKSTNHVSTKVKTNTKRTMGNML